PPDFPTTPMPGRTLPRPPNTGPGNDSISPSSNGTLPRQMAYRAFFWKPPVGAAADKRWCRKVWGVPIGTAGPDRIPGPLEQQRAGHGQIQILFSWTITKRWDKKTNPGHSGFVPRLSNR